MSAEKLEISVQHELANSTDVDVSADDAYRFAKAHEGFAPLAWNQRLLRKVDWRLLPISFVWCGVIPFFVRFGI